MRNTLVNFEALTLLFLITAHCCFISAIGQFTTTPGDLTVREGDALTTNCSFTNADSLFWRKGGTMIETGESFSVNMVGGDTSQLTLLPSADHTVHTGAYECVAVTGSNENTAEFNITVQYLSAPIIDIEPFECVQDGGNPYVGSEVIIRCTAEGEPLPQVTWFYNEVHEVRPGEGDFSNVIFQQDNRTLIINPLQSVNSGHYHCQSDNVIGQESAISISLGFRTNNQRIEVVNDVNGIIFAQLGGFARIECQVLPPFPRVDTSMETVIFREGTTTLQQGGRYNIIAKQCNVFVLVINDILNIHATQYQCTFGQETAMTNLRIATIIPTRLDVSSTVIGVGREVELNCSTVRRPGSQDVPQVLAWRFMAAGSPIAINVIADGRRVIISRDEAAISANLTIRQAELSDNGTYFCVAFNPGNLVDPVENKVDLIVEGRPVVTVTPPTDDAVRVGTSLLLTCSISTERSSIFSWTVNGLPITSSNASYTLTNPLPYQSSINITSVLPKDIGPIRCSAEDPIHLPADEVVSVSEEVQPYIVGDGSGVTTVDVEINTTLSLNCDLRGTFSGTPTIQWFLGNRQLTNGSGVTVTGGRSSSSTLTKSSVSLSDDATYKCIVRLGADSFMMDFIAFVTIPPVLMNMLPETTEGFEGQRFELTCEVSGRPTPKVFWKQNLNKVSELRDPLIRDAGNGSLLFERLQSDHAGIYTCTVEGSESITGITQLEVVQMEPMFRVGILNRSETILVFTVFGLVAVLIAIATVMLIAVVISCYSMRRSPQGKYTVKHDSIDGAFKRQASLRDNSGIHSSPSNHIFDTLQSPASASSAYNNTYITGPPTSVPLTTYQGPAPLYYQGGGGPANSVFSEQVNSHTSTPIHGTMASTSLFGSEEHTSVTAQTLPNFPRSSLQLGDIMGEGEFGPVIMGVATNIIPGEERTLVAVKELVQRGEEGEDELNPELALVDFANQMKLEFGNIAMILGMCTDHEPYYVIYEYLDEGDLKKFLINNRPFDDDPPSLTPQHMRKIILQVADGMAYLFSQRIIHGDLATRNCLVSSDLRVKIADLGIGHDLYNHDYYDNGSQLLPIRWMPPELLVASDEGPTFSLHSDIWSFGVFCWEVFSYSRLPYDTLTDEEVLSMVPAGTRLRSPSKSCPPALYDIMMDCWHEIPEERPVFAKLCVAIIDCELD